MNDEASLDNLRDIVELAPVSWWPPAPGWWLLFAGLLLALTYFSIRTWQNWRANAYRRVALRELQSATSVATIADILKRTALSVYPRDEVASLTGRAYCQWLQDTGGRQVPVAVERSLTVGVFSDRCSTDLSETLAFATHWIHSHKTSAEGKGTD